MAFKRSLPQEELRKTFEILVHPKDSAKWKVKLLKSPYTGIVFFISAVQISPEEDQHGQIQVTFKVEFEYVPDEFIEFTKWFKKQKLKVLNILIIDIGYLILHDTYVRDLPDTIVVEGTND